jgi:hypothetical protein
MLLAKILYECHKPYLQSSLQVFFIPIMLLLAGRVFRKTMFPQHMRTNTTDASCVFKVTESFLKLVVLPIGLKETQSLFCRNL